MDRVVKPIDNSSSAALIEAQNRIRELRRRIEEINAELRPKVKCPHCGETNNGHFPLPSKPPMRVCSSCGKYFPKVS